MMRTRLGALTVAAMSVAACGSVPVATPGTSGDATPPTEADVPTADAPPTTVVTTGPGEEPGDTDAVSELATLARCGDIAIASTDVVSDPPVGGNVDDVFLGVLQTYASEHPDTFGGLWIDREAFGTVVLAFTDDPAEHLDALGRRAPSPDDLGVTEPPPEITDDRPISEWDLSFDVVRVEHNEQALIDAMRPVFDVASSLPTEVSGGSVDIRRSRVSIEFAAPVTPADLSELAVAVTALDGVSIDMVCWEGLLASEAPAPIEPGTPLEVAVAPGPDGVFDPETRVACDAIGEFRLGDLDDTTPLDDVDPGLLAVLDGWLSNEEGQFWPQDGWALLFARDGFATFVRIADDGVTTVSAEMAANGWIWAGAAGGGTCDVMLALPQELRTVEWALDPSVGAPDPSSTQIEVLATERSCASGQEMGDRLLGPQVVETDESVGIVFAVIPLSGGQECPGNPSTSVTVELDAPLGDREIRDALLIAPMATLLDS